MPKLGTLRAASGAPSMLSPGSMGRTALSAPRGPFGLGFLAIMRMAIRCPLRVMSRRS